MKNKTTAGLLALFLGGLGTHRFYLGKGGSGVIYILFFWTLIPAIIAFFEGIILLTMSQERFDKDYNKGEVEESKMNTCKYCYSKINIQATICKHCRSKV